MPSRSPTSIRRVFRLSGDEAPHVKLVDGLTRQIDWPETVFYRARVEGLERDVVLLLGMEPNLRWRAFTEMVTGFAEELGVELVITLGSLLADIPHTRPSPVTGSASDEELVERLGLQASRYEGPTGIVGILHDACKQRELPSASLWAAVPHVSLTPSPAPRSRSASGSGTSSGSRSTWRSCARPRRATRSR